jgi:hypothetical protein
MSVDMHQMIMQNCIIQYDIQIDSYLWPNVRSVEVVPNCTHDQRVQEINPLSGFMYDS